MISTTQSYRYLLYLKYKNHKKAVTPTQIRAVVIMLTTPVDVQIARAIVFASREFPWGIP